MDAYRIRRNAYWAVLSGACGYCAGTRLWRYEPGWRGLLDATSTRQAPLMLRLLGPRPWWRLVPDAKHELVTAGYGASGQADYVTAAMADDRRLGLAFLPSARRITVGLAAFAGGLTASWFDPTSGRSIAVEGSPFANRGSRDFTPPAKNLAGDVDYVLVLEVAE